MGPELQLSVCMIVKNEEKNLRRCLETVKFADEIIVVDTGSTDRTIEIAEEYGCIVKRHGWKNNFSLHRNQSIGYATGHWLLFIDADEDLNGKTDDLKTWLKTVPENINGVCVTMHDIQGGRVQMQYNPPKIFRNGKVEFKDIVHNRPVLKGNKEYLYCPLVFYRHYGYDLTQEQRLAKVERTTGLLKERLRQSKSDWQAHYYLVMQYGWINDWENAAQHAEIYLKNKDKQGTNFNPSIYWTAIRMYMVQLKQLENAERWLKIAIADQPNNLDILLSMCEYGVTTNNQAMIGQAAQGFISNYAQFEQRRGQMGTQFVHSYNAESLGYCTYHLGRLQIMTGMNTIQTLAKILPLTEKSFEAKMGDELRVFMPEIATICEELTPSKEEKLIVTPDEYKG